MANTTKTLQCIDYHGYNCSGPSLPEKSQPIILIIISFFIVVTILSNLLIISSVIIFRQLQTHTNILAMSLAVSDFSLGSMVMPLRMMGTVYNCWYYDYSFCNVLYFVDYTLCTSSIFHLSCAIVAMLLISWLGAALFTSPSLLSFSPQLAPGAIEREGCPDDCLFSVDVSLHFFYGACPYFITMLVIMAVYARIYHVARRQARQIKAATTKVQSQGQQRVSVFPFVSNFDVEYEVATWMGYISSAVNPLLYASFNRQFRGAFRKILSLRI
uniref:G-protein coupled receptors family 1 profile domain-containing protein n=1 Tax=Petromyzon marinus TaxID=7757 RepID=S4RBT2_PETMA